MKYIQMPNTSAVQYTLPQCLLSYSTFENEGSRSHARANMPLVFDKKANETEKLKKQFEVEKTALERKIGELTIDIDWLKKKQEQALEMKKKRNS